MPGRAEIVGFFTKLEIDAGTFEACLAGVAVSTRARRSIKWPLMDSGTGVPLSAPVFVEWDRIESK